MRIRTSLLLVPFALTCAATAVIARINGPIAGVTGALAVTPRAAEPTCRQAGCHGDLALNLPGATLQILDVPDTYWPDSVYTLRVRMTSTFAPVGVGRRWGFQLTAVNAANGDSAGSFAPLNNTTQAIAGTGSWTFRRYIEHTSTGTLQGNNGPVEWQFRWKAPGGNVARVYFFAAGNASDNSGTNNGDHIYTARDTSDLSPNVGAPSAPRAGVALAAAPNPARGSTTVRFLLAQPADVSLDVLDVQGRIVRALVRGERGAGSHTIAWDGDAADGTSAPAGLYFVRLAHPGAAPRVTRVVLQR